MSRVPLHKEEILGVRDKHHVNDIHLIDVCVDVARQLG